MFISALFRSDQAEWKKNSISENKRLKPWRTMDR